MAKAARVNVAPSGYLILDTLPTVLALPASSVLGVVRASDWTAELPYSLGELLPVQFSVSHPAWVLRVTSEADTIPITFCGTPRMAYLRSDSLLSLSSVKFCGFQSFTDLVLANGKVSALVVNTDALLKSRPKREI